MKNKCQAVILAPTKEQGVAVVETFKKAEELCGCVGKVNHTILVPGKDEMESTIRSDECCMFTFTAESQEDWDMIKK